MLWDAGAADDVEDVLSQVAEELLRNPPSDIKNWEAFLVTITKRRSIDHLRSARLQHQHGSVFDFDTMPSELFQIDDFLRGVDLGKALKVAAAERDSLPEPDRTIACECLWAGNRQQDVARDLGITQARVSQILKRVRRTIMNAVQEKGGPL